MLEKPNLFCLFYLKKKFLSLQKLVLSAWKNIVTKYISLKKYIYLLKTLKIELSVNLKVSKLYLVCCNHQNFFLKSTIKKEGQNL